MNIRPASAAELHSAIRLILCSASGHADERQVADLLYLAQEHHADLGGTWIAHYHARLISAVLPVVSPGRTVLIFPPAYVHGLAEETATRRLIETVCDQARAAGVQLAQVLLDHRNLPLNHVLLSRAFQPLAELLYLQATVRGSLPPPALPPLCRFVTYSTENHELFARTILGTYRQSLDCPALNGLRDIADILAGHKATGQFDPALWFVLCQGDSPLGVLLLASLPRSDIIELVYLGVVPEHRCRGAGDLLMRHALHVASTSRYARLSLAVDARNLPALGLYWRHGLQAIGKKTAMLRDLRMPSLVLGPAVQKLKERQQPPTPSTT